MHVVRRSAARARRDVLVAQLGLLVFLGVAIALWPGLVLKWNQAGLSNYGVHARTIVPYSVALLLCSAFSASAARALPGDGSIPRRVRAVLYAYAVLMLLSLLSTYPYKVNTLFKDIHVSVNITTALFGAVASAWMALRLRPGRARVFWFGLQLTGFVLSVIDYVGGLHVLFMSQALASLGFGGLIVIMVRQVAVVANSAAHPLT